jgi:type II secretory pathway component PulK
MRPGDQRGGFAMVTAIVLLGLVALTLASLGVAFVFESRRTLSLAQDAQLRQLLLAGTSEARSRLAAGGLDKSISIDLPDDLRQRGASLRLQPQQDASTGQTVVEIEAELPRHRMAQRVRLARQETGWQIVAAELIP